MSLWFLLTFIGYKYINIYDCTEVVYNFIGPNYFSFPMYICIEGGCHFSYRCSVFLRNFYFMGTGTLHCLSIESLGLKLFDIVLEIHPDFNFNDDFSIRCNNFIYCLMLRRATRHKKVKFFKEFLMHELRSQLICR